MKLLRDMSMNSNDEFLKALMSLEVIAEEPLEYRFYYDEEGNIVSCSMRQHPDGNYVVVTEDEYKNYFRYTVVNGKPKLIVHDTGFKVQLKKSTKGYPVVKNHAGIILEDETYSDIEYYDTNS